MQDLVPLSEVIAFEERICSSLGSVNAATAELVDVISEVIERGAWQGVGIRSPQHWVSWKCAVSGARAKRLVAMATVLPELPACRALFLEGRLTEDHAATICKYTLPCHDTEVAELAPECTPSQLGRALRLLPHRRDLEPPASVAEPEPEPEPEPPAEGDTHGRRSVDFGSDDDGRWWARMILPPDEGALVEKALGLARDDLFADGRSEVGWSDALVHLAETAIDGFADPDRCDHPQGGRRRRRRGGERFTVVIHQRDDQARSAEIHLGPRLPDSLRRYLTCDANVRWVLDRDGNPYKVAATHRTVPDWLRTLIEDRDQCCRVPGCGRRRWLHVHHIHHWEDGGLTIPENLIALCRYHHREHHLGRLHIRGDPTTPNGLIFTDASGRRIQPLHARPPNRQPRPQTSYKIPCGERINLYWLFWSNPN